MKKKYKYEVFGVTYYDGISEGTSETFDKIKDAKNFVEKVKSSSFRRIDRRIFKYEERNGEPYRYVKRIWIYKKGNWYSTRKVYKDLLFMEF